MNKTVRYQIDLNNLPPQTNEQVAELKALSEMSDSEINFSDIPSLNDAFWTKAVKNTFYKPT